MSGKDVPKVAVVTGGARGLGLTTALTLAGRGNDIGLIDVDGATLSDAADRIRRETGSTVHTATANVSKEDDVRRARDAIESSLGGVGVLVNNAGVGGASRLEDMELSDWSSIIDTNLTGTLVCSKVFGRGMLDWAAGSIVNMASIMGLTFLPTRAAYAAAKAAIIGLTKVAAVEWAARGVRVNAVAPGYTVTDGVQGAIDAGIIRPDMVLGRTPMRRLGQPQDTADAIAFLASAEAGFVTGQVLVVDGGYTSYGAWWGTGDEFPGTPPVKP